MRARFADARHFWDLDRKARLEALVPKLDHVIFHAKLGSQGERVRRLENLAAHIAPLVGAGPELARAAARLCKADLLSGMVGEFPELQGVMGRYYALHDGEDALVADAIRDHYAPKGPGDAVPTAPVSVAVALADKLDSLAGFFAIEEKPTGSSDPYALRRAALGVIRIIRENNFRLSLSTFFDPLISWLDGLDSHRPDLTGTVTVVGPPGVRLMHGLSQRVVPEVVEFVIERLRVQLRAEGARHDVLTAVFATGADDDIVRLLARSDAVAALLGSETGGSLLAAYKRAANILRIEERKDGPHDDAPDPALLHEAEEKTLTAALRDAAPVITACLAAEDFAGAMAAMAGLRGTVDAFFEKVTVNAKEPELRRNRLALLHRLRATMDQVADFSRIEG